MTERFKPTASQTIGPYFRLGTDWLNTQDLIDPGDPAAVVLWGQVLDGAGAPVSDALVEIWQADTSGRFGGEARPGWTGFGRCRVEEDGAFRFTTVKPGRVPGRSGLQAPHIDVSVFARGLLQRLVTRIYFPDEMSANEEDPILRSIGDPLVHSTLIARREADGSLRFDIHLQGPRETAFFAY